MREGASMGRVRVWEGVSFGGSVGGCEYERGESVGGCEWGRVQVWEGGKCGRGESVGG